MLDEEPPEVLPVDDALASALLEVEDLFLVNQDLGAGGSLDAMGEPAVIDVGVSQQDPADLFETAAQGFQARGQLVPALVAVDPGVYEDEALACIYWEAVGEADVDGLEGGEVRY